MFYPIRRQIITGNVSPRREMMLIGLLCGALWNWPATSPRDLAAAEPARPRPNSATATTTASAAPLPGIAFVGGPVVDGAHDGHNGAYHWRDGYVYPKGATNNAWERTHSAPRPGRNLFTLTPATPDGTLRQLTFLKTGNVYDPEPAYDGKKLLFSMRRDGEDWYHLYEVNIDGSGMRQLTDGPFNDVSGVYLPDGRIVFCSDRTGVLDEYHEERSEFLFRMQQDGSGIEQITFVPGTYFEPTVLRNGLILCSFWDAFHISVPPFIKHETYLITLRPDGTDERPFFGAAQYKFYNRTRHAAIGLTRPGELPDGRILVQSELGPSIYDPNVGIHLAESLAPIFPGTASVQTGGTTHMIHLSPLGTRGSNYPLPDGRFLMAATSPGSRDIGLYVVNPQTREMALLYDRPNLSEWDAVPIGLARTVPASLPDQVTPAAEPSETARTARFIVVAGRDSDTPERNALNARARFLRVLQAEYTELAVSSHTSLETRILGTVPLQPDGSAVFDAPAETPLFLETLDARGNRLVLQAGYMAARAGEVKSCAGCHTPVSGAVANSDTRALRLEIPQVRRESTDLSYRRNEPDEYRREAGILQSEEARKWLLSNDPRVQVRGVDWLALMPDEVTPRDRQMLVELLESQAVELRQRSAFALAMIGSADQIAALIKALRDTDWQTRFYAGMALEAITGEHLDLRVDIERTAEVWEKWWRETGSVQTFVRGLADRMLPDGDSFARDAWLEAIARTRWLDKTDSVAMADAVLPRFRDRVLELLQAAPPQPTVVKAAGWLRDPQAIALLTPWLIGGANPRQDEAVPDSDAALEREVRGMALAKEAALALGRIGGPEAIAALWQAARQAVPNPKPAPSRHYQTGPRPEEYTYLRALILAKAMPSLDEVPLLIGLLPSTFGEKPRFEDRTKPRESQRATLARILLDRAGLRKPVIDIAVAILQGNAVPAEPLYQKLLAGTNNDRPYSEHGHPFPVLKELSPEQALQYINCLSLAEDMIPEELLAAQLKSPNHRDRIEASVALRRLGVRQPATLALLRTLVAEPYAFSEIWSIGKGRFELNFRDKAYMAITLAAYDPDPAGLRALADYTRSYRDIRLGLALGLGFRHKADRGAGELLQLLAGDPIFSVHRTAENSRIRLQDRALLSGEQFTLPLAPYQPLKPVYAANRPMEFSEQTVDPLAGPARVQIDPTQPEAVLKAFQSAVDPAGYANVGNTFARNAERMRIGDAGLLEQVILGEAGQTVPLSADLEQGVRAAINSPYPFAHYLACKWIALRGDPRFNALLIEKLPVYVEQADTVGFYWGAEALGRLNEQAAQPMLIRYTTSLNQPRVYGSPGMAYGFAAARGLGLMARTLDDAQLQRLLTDRNPWLISGLVEGLGLAHDPRARQVLEQISSGADSIFLEEQTRYARTLLDRTR